NSLSGSLLVSKTFESIKISTSLFLSELPRMAKFLETLNDESKLKISEILFLMLTISNEHIIASSKFFLQSLFKYNSILSNSSGEQNRIINNSFNFTFVFCLYSTKHCIIYLFLCIFSGKITLGLSSFIFITDTSEPVTLFFFECFSLLNLV